MANTIASKVWREKYYKSRLSSTLRNALVSRAICEVDESNSMLIKNPYQSKPTVTISALAGTYSVTDWTTTDDNLQITDEFKVAEHIFDFESSLADFDLFNARADERANAIKEQVDKYVLNNVLEDGTGTYTTAVGGFTTVSNINKIVGDLVGLVSGYADAYKGLYLVVESTDITGFIQAGMANGFNFADATLNNGFGGVYGGVEVYVVRTGTFADATMGTKTFTNAGHRLFGVKNVVTFAMPGGIKYEEKGVSGKTGMETVTYGYVGYKVWAPKAGLIVDITLA